MKEQKYELNSKTWIFALSSGNACKYELLTGKNLLTGKYLLEKAATMKRYECSPSGSELKAQTDIAKT